MREKGKKNFKIDLVKDISIIEDANLGKSFTFIFKILSRLF